MYEFKEMKRKHASQVCGASVVVTFICRVCEHWKWEEDGEIWNTEEIQIWKPMYEMTRDCI